MSLLKKIKFLTKNNLNIDYANCGKYLLINDDLMNYLDNNCINLLNNDIKIITKDNKLITIKSKEDIIHYTDCNGEIKKSKFGTSIRLLLS